MVINTTRWSPDTCGCELEYTWDTETSEDERTHNFKRVVKTCNAHMPVVPRGLKAEEAKQVYDTVLEENQRKNQTLAKVLEVRPELADFVDGRTGKRYDLSTVSKQIQITDPNEIAEVLGIGGGGITLKEGIDFKWNWVDEPKTRGLANPRTLEIDFDVPVSVEHVIAAKTTNPNATTKQIQLHAKQQMVGGESDKLQSALDKEFTKEKGRGQVKVKK